ncbi:MAG: HPr family phosphocarrier protein [Verrucomicrobiae bacterium]|nr:HPr family phosphocarrier protein [Verrucomicrobiae bacterium]MCX7721839.1 HPr family phosphocarrier protein [Verrucomicrobiae bacterium]MDW7978959.1 HPr family phosphocarrier protein [Verrucomicrobiales bacterium]
MTARKQVETPKVVTREVEITNKLGLHARPAAMFVKVANKFASDIYVEKDGEKINGKSIIGLLMLAAGPGSKLRLHAEGHDAHQAVAELERLIKRKFDEE